MIISDSEFKRKSSFFHFFHHFLVIFMLIEYPLKVEQIFAIIKTTNCE